MEDINIILDGRSFGFKVIKLDFFFFGLDGK